MASVPFIIFMLFNVKLLVYLKINLYICIAMEKKFEDENRCCELCSHYDWETRKCIKRNLELDSLEIYTMWCDWYHNGND